MKKNIRISTNTEGNLYVAVENTALFDFVDDYLTDECRIEYEHVIESEDNGVPVYTIIFAKEVNSVVLETVLNNLSIVEIEKTYNRKKHRFFILYKIANKTFKPGQKTYFSHQVAVAT